MACFQSLGALLYSEMRPQACPRRRIGLADTPLIQSAPKNGCAFSERTEIGRHGESQARSTISLQGDGLPVLTQVT
ncbi:hypothetical protein SBBP2_170003 [Burkholderiales bacterium]|nr:hypothetical protein SBBP2_170003 [Burkholderiales bacterium]